MSYDPPRVWRKNGVDVVYRHWWTEPDLFHWTNLVMLGIGLGILLGVILTDVL